MATRILLIDDDSVDRAAVRRALGKSELAAEVVEAADGASGLALAAEGGFDCVLLDYRLPDIDAFDALAVLISPEGGNNAVIMLTGETDTDLALRLMRAGALDYLSKTEANPSGLARAIRYARARRAFVSELEAARREAEQKSRALDLLNRQKNLLFSIIAHDLRNPFQALLGLSTLLAQSATLRDEAAVERRAEGIKHAAAQAYALMESLFAWASLQMDTTDVVLESVDLAAVIGETMSGAAEAAATKGVELRAASEGLRLRTHRDMLLAVLRNLVSNAIKFTEPGGIVTVGGEARGDAVDISVSDTGVGISAEALEALFKPDVRSTTAGTAGERGSGLGLLICHELIERLGSSLTVASSVGIGTRFSFSVAADEAAGEPGDEVAA